MQNMNTPPLAWLLPPALANNALGATPNQPIASFVDYHRDTRENNRQTSPETRMSAHLLRVKHVVKQHSTKLHGLRGLKREQIRWFGVTPERQLVARGTWGHGSAVETLHLKIFPQTNPLLESVVD